MRKLAALPLILLSFALSACNDTLDSRNSEIANNKIYQIGKNEGFSGKITNIPLGKLPYSEIVPVVNLIAKATGNKDINNLIYTESLSVGHDTVLCDTSSVDGVLNGETSCKSVPSGNRIIKMNFKNGVIDGKATFYYAFRKDVRLADVDYLDGKASGLLIIYGFTTGNPIYKVKFENGVLNGSETALDENSGKAIFEGNLVNGKYQGETIRYNANGSVAEKTMWNNGVAQDYQDKPAQTETNSVDCLGAWIAAFHKEKGSDAPISSEQTDEWKTWCDQGKKPNT
ncbi:toxin-antitoxin system YwqK family antitoxin [Pseudoduganella violacea]|uniref:Antitoxin component YwqK of YwqJK toxin-antitoxin module n=1 Tax=Pseudoduganella violacea TaxID=1715466 RepID=A0A7W5B862_9BURK|nr:hypothetical protein [Pseudoduganella violacea]MBB3117570.1 antitoxin component YwqK of YwqJK toxin-antitoxin module [Pseudoduganella violacea]